MTFTRHYDKYLVVKMEDIREYLLDVQQRQLSMLTETVAIGRQLEGKKDNRYVVVNEDEPYAEEVWNLIEQGEKNG